MECPNCKKEIPDESKFCPECGSEIRLVNQEVPAKKEVRITVFDKFDKHGFNPTWNWSGFFFSWAWYFTKGLWIKGMAIFLISMYTSGLVNGFFHLPYYIFKTKWFMWLPLSSSILGIFYIPSYSCGSYNIFDNSHDPNTWWIWLLTILYCTLFGKWDLYLWKVKHKQLW